MVDIIDIGMGNVCSIRNILSRIGVNSKIVTDPAKLSSPVAILPGVGSARPFMQKIRVLKFDKALQRHINSGNKLIGICLGFQVMTEFSEEDGGTSCLGLIKSETVALTRHSSSSNHNQWEKFSLRKEDLYLSGVSSLEIRSRKRTIHGRVFYNHEYGVKIPDDTSSYKKINDHHLHPYASMYYKNNIIGIQFHPEKSQLTGLELFSMIL